MNQTLQDCIEDYLDGRLDPEETRRFEQDLMIKDDVAAAFREMLLLRDLLGQMSPEQTPPGLVERIETAMTGNASDRPEEQRALPVQRFGRPVAGMKFGWGWTGHAFAGLAGSSGALKGSISGVRTIGYSLGPLRDPARKGMHAVQLMPKAIWKRALSGLLRGVLP